MKGKLDRENLNIDIWWVSHRLWKPFQKEYNIISVPFSKPIDKEIEKKIQRLKYKSRNRNRKSRKEYDIVHLGLNEPLPEWIKQENPKLMRLLEMPIRKHKKRINGNSLMARLGNDKIEALKQGKKIKVLS